MERAGQGADRMLEECVRQSKPLPDYGRSDAQQVWLTLHGEIQDEEFLRLLARVGEETLSHFDPHDFLILGLLAADKKPPAELQPRLPRLVDLGVLQRSGRGKVVLSRKHYRSGAKETTEARKKEQARERNKGRLLKEIEERKDGVSLKELTAKLPDLTRNQVQTLLKHLRKEDKAHPVGGTKGARWHPGPEPGIADKSRE